MRAVIGPSTGARPSGSAGSDSRAELKGRGRLRPVA
jgi:hypothetical protein